VNRLSPAERWFASHGWKTFAFQREVWNAYLDGESGLIHAATGTGKTLAAWWGPLLEAKDPRRGRTMPLTVLWITPLRALAADTAEALRRPVEDLGLPWTVETRTGDTPPGTKARQGRKLPSTLVTTPESLSLLLSRDDASAQFAGLKLVVVDEWHELMGSKRGVQTQLALARLRSMCPGLRTWGLSATIGNIDEAKRTLLGTRHVKSRIVRGEEPKTVIVDSLIPPVIERFPWAGHLGTAMVAQVCAAIDEGETSIVFTNTRSQTEIWYQAILEHRPDWAGSIALHHGSLDRRTRDWVEEGLRESRLRCVVATSSLDLGVDFSPVDRVLQIGSPKGIARLMQRAGRSGHRPGARSRVTCVPTHTLELIEVAAARDGMEAGAIESRYPVARPLDVLAQHLVTIAVGEGFVPDEMLEEVRSTDAFSDLPGDEWQWVLSFISSGGDSLKGYPEYSRAAPDETGVWRVIDRTIARRHRMSVGTIVSDAHIVVQYLRGGRLGSVEESFIARLRPGDHFVFAGKSLEFVRVRDLVAWVRRAPDSKAAIPRWMGSRLPLSGELAAAIRARLGEAQRGVFRGDEMHAVEPILKVQAKWSRIPSPDEFLIERVQSREGFHLYFFPFEGRLVHEGLAALFALRMSRIRPISFSMSFNDYGFELLSPDEAPLDESLERGLLDPENLVDDIPASLNATEMARRQFREIARVAGLVFPGYPRAGKSARQLQASSGLFFDVFTRYDAGNMLIAQAHREVLERQLERTRLGRTLHRLSRSEVVVTAPKRTPPLAFPLLVDRTREKLSSEKLSDRVRRMQRALERAAK
jgi:ATP-dependent Lhr-like helicase